MKPNILQTVVVLFLLLGTVTSNGKSHVERKDSVGEPKIYQKEKNILLDFPVSYDGRTLMITSYVDRGFGFIGRPCSGYGMVTCSILEQKYLALSHKVNVERTLVESDLDGAIANSNVQPIEELFPIVSYNQDSTCLTVDITEKVLASSNWNKIGLSNIRSYKPNSTKLVRIENQSNSSILITQSYYGYISDILHSETIPPIGYLPLWLRYEFQWLSDIPMKVRIALPVLPVIKLPICDFSHTPYGMINDSIVAKWRLTDSPIAIAVHPQVPKSLRIAFQQALSCWNELFQSLGASRELFALHFSEVDSSNQRRMPITLNFDMGEPKVAVTNVINHQTGEIVKSTINWGNGAHIRQMEYYLLTNGKYDERICKNHHHPTVKQKILKYLAIRALGEVLGITPEGKFDYKQISTELASTEYDSITMPKVLTLECLQIAKNNSSNSKREIELSYWDKEVAYYLYGNKKKQTSPYDDYNQILTNFRKRSVKYKNQLCNHQQKINDIDQILSSIAYIYNTKLTDVNVKTINYYRNSLSELNVSALKLMQLQSDQLVEFMVQGNSQREDKQQVVELLNRYYFASDCPLLQPVLATVYYNDNSYRYEKLIKNIFHKLYNKETVITLFKKSTNDSQANYKEFYADIRSQLLFSQFRKESNHCFELLSYYIQTLIALDQEKHNSEFYSTFLRNEIKILSSELTTYIQQSSDEVNRVTLNYLSAYLINYILNKTI